MPDITENLVSKTIRIRPNNSHKGTYGRVGLIGGSQNFGGAIIMASKASVYSGAGLTTTFTDSSNLTSLHDHVPEAMFADYNDIENLKEMIPGFNVIVIGPGLGTDYNSLKILKATLNAVSHDQIVIIDGSAITLMAKEKLSVPDAQVIFTPHQMEWQRLSGIKISDQNDTNNTDAVKKLHSIVVLKSHHTKIYTKDEIFVNPGGTPAQATGGMGDTLAGMVAGFTAQFSNTDNAVISAVYSHSAIADKLSENQYVVLPTQIIEKIPFFMKNHQTKK